MANYLKQEFFRIFKNGALQLKETVDLEWAGTGPLAAEHAYRYNPLKVGIGIIAKAMKHAGEETLNLLSDLLEKLRTVDGLKERKRGTFYFRGAAFLHFHEDPEGIFADLKIAGRWSRLPASTKGDQALVLAAVVREAAH